MRYGQMVMGPAGSGKSSFCATMVRHCEAIGRRVHVVNLDPAAESFDYPVAIDVRELISLDDVIDELAFGPNGGLIYCMEFLLENLEWLTEQLGAYEDDYLIFDCPGQIELYVHFPIMRNLVEFLQQQDYRLCAVYLIDSQFVIDPSKFMAGALSAMSAMIALEVPHINVMSKMDLLGKRGERESEMNKYYMPDTMSLLEEVNRTCPPRYQKLNHAIGGLLDSYSLVNFLPLNRLDEDSVGSVLLQIDNTIQYGEDEDIHIKPDEDEENDGDLESNVENLHV